MLKDPTHIFRRMWAAEPWGAMDEGDACWNIDRHGKVRQKGRTFFDAVDQGLYCDSNWYEGSGYGPWDLPDGGSSESSSNAPALLGFDEDIDAFCWQVDCGDHAACCLKRGVNILALFGDEIPYNLCRNLEWQVCAARGLLPGQQSSTLVFAHEPRALFPDGTVNDKPLGQCQGYAPYPPPTGGVYGYRTDDIFFLEVCMFHHLCKNGDELFNLKVGEHFECDYDRTALYYLERMLDVPFERRVDDEERWPRCDAD